MREEHKIVKQVHDAQHSNDAADALVRQYLPFIKSETAKFTGHAVQGDSDDTLSIAMFAFYEAILSYQSGKGSFLRFAATGIRNRLIDHYRREQRHVGVDSLDRSAENEENNHTLLDQLVSKQDEISERTEYAAAKAEIQNFSAHLSEFGLTLSDVADGCPRQARTLAACMRALDYARRTPEVLEQLVQSGKLPLLQLSTGAGVERKTLERHRKYMIAILLAYTNGFEIIRGHLRQINQNGGHRA